MMERMEGNKSAAAEALGISPDDPVVYLERVRMADGEPLLLERARLPAQRFPGLLAFDFERRSLYDILGERYATRIVRARETVEPVMLRRREAELLALPTRALALQIDGVAYASDGSPVEVARSFVRGDRTRYYLERDVVRAHWLDSTGRTRAAVAGIGRREPRTAPGGEEGRG
jgi:GntR family transcriptional regulator